MKYLAVTLKVNQNMSLIIKKFEQWISGKRIVQYEIYHPITKKKLNLSICNTEKIDIYIPIKLNNSTKKLYQDLQSYGYNLFNINDPFYNDICSPYKTQNGTDILLSDRKNDYFNNNYSTCQFNCQYSSYDIKYELIKCECAVIIDDINIKDINKFSKKIYKSFYDVLKYSNYKILKCYKLVFKLEYFKKNIGNFIIISYFIIYISMIVIYIIKDNSKLTENILKIINIKFKNNKEKIINFPPIKRKTVVINSNEILEINQKKRRKSAILKQKIKNKRDIKSYISSNQKIIDIENENSKNNYIAKANNLIKDNKDKDEIYYNYNNLDDLDLDNLTYEKAIEFDKRTLYLFYISKLKKKHLIIFTFLSCNDYNLISIKISRFLFLLSTNMTMNVIFFFDSSMHKIYLDYGKYNFIQQIPQILYSSISVLIIEILISSLSFTDVYIEEARQIKSYDKNKFKEIIKKSKIKLIIFFIITFIFFAFYWYLISAFCAVYNNTQIIYIKDFSVSFSLGLIYPFAIQLCLSFVRLFALKKNTKIRKLLFKIC